MNSLALLLAPIALLVPLAVPAPETPQEQAKPVGAAPSADLPPISVAEGPAPFAIQQEAIATPVQDQVRIEQRVVIRIAPHLNEVRQRLMPEPPRAASPQRLKEQRLKGCVPLEGIAAVQPSADNRLLLLMRDRRLLSAQVEKSCNAREFYSGAYVERNADGQFCARRDHLQSRTGASCEVSHLNRLVSADD